MANEINRIVKLFTDLQHGRCWIGVNFREVLHGIDAKKAGEDRGEGHNNIWQLVSHITYWRTRVVYRLTGSANPPAFADFLVPEALKEFNWRPAETDLEAA